MARPSKPKNPKEPSIAPIRRPASRAPKPPPPSMTEDVHDRIARRAYEIYLERTHQGPLDDWLKAEREILG